jgi:hypothetical protein
MSKTSKWILGILFNPGFTLYLPLLYLEEVGPYFNFSLYAFPPFMLLCFLWVFGGIGWGMMLTGEFDE